MKLKGTLHIHTNRSDGAFSVEEVVKMHIKAGYDFIAISDHDIVLKPDELKNLRCKFPEILIFNSMEFSISCDDHIGIVYNDNGEEFVILNHPEIHCGNVEEKLNILFNKVKEKFKNKIDAIEITNQGQKSKLLVDSNLPLIKVASDDFHDNCNLLGSSYILVEVDEKSISNVFNSLKFGKVQAVC